MTPHRKNAFVDVSFSVIGLFSFLMLGGEVHSSASSSGASPSPQDKKELPVEINADKGVECDKEHHKCKAFMATVTQDTFTLKGNLLTAYFDSKEGLKKVDASGNVLITSSQDYKALAQEGSFDMDSGIAVLEKSAEAYDFKKNRRLKGDKIVLYFSKEKKDVRNPGEELKLKKADVYGNVTIKTPKELSKSDHASYEAQKDFALLTGNVRIFSEKGELAGDQAEMDLKTGVSKMTSRKGPVKIFLKPNDHDQKSDKKKVAHG